MSVIGVPSTAEVLDAWVMSALLPEFPEQDDGAAIAAPETAPKGAIRASENSRSRRVRPELVEVIMCFPREMVSRRSPVRASGGGTAGSAP